MQTDYKLKINREIMLYRALLIIFCLLLTALPAKSVSRKITIDDLLQQCEEARSMSSYSKLDVLSQQLIRESNEQNDKRGLGYGYLYKGLYLLFSGKGEQSVAAFDDAWQTSRKIHNDSIGALVQNARGIYQAMYNNNNFLAQQFFFQSLDMAEDANYEALKIRVYGNLLVLTKSADDKEGFNYAQRIYEYGVKHKDMEQEFMGAYYLALFYKLQGNYKEALQYVRASLKLYDQKPYDDVASVYVLYSEIETELGHLDQALHLALMGETLAKKYNQTNLLPDVYLQIAQAHHCAGRYAESNTFINKALELSKENSLDNRIIDGYRLMASNDIKMGDKDGAIAYLLKANAGMDTLSQTNMERLMQEREMLDKVHKKERQAEIKQQEADRQHRAAVMMVVISLILLVALVVITMILHSRNQLIKRIVAQNVRAVENQKKARQRIEELEQTQTTAGDSSDKASSRLIDDDERKQQLYDRICELMDTKKPYTTPQFTREKLAGMLGTNRTYLSTVIKEKSGMNYQQFINSYRINEAIRILSDRETVDYPLKQLWSDLGFTSSSSFYKLFQQTVGITPSVYRKQYLEM